MTFDVTSVIQSIISAVISGSLIIFIHSTRKHRRREERELKLMNIKLESMYAGLTNINSQFSTIGTDFKQGYEEKKNELMKDNDFVEEE